MRHYFGWMGVAMLVWATGCQESETDLEQMDTGTAMAIRTQIINTKADGDAVVDDVKIPAAYSIGVHLTSQDGLKNYEQVAGLPVPRAHNIRFYTSGTATEWKAADSWGGTFAGTIENPFYLTTLNARVYAYYPYKAVTASTYGDNATIPVSILESGTIAALKNNAELIFSGGTWIANPAANQKLITAAPDEQDYMWADLPDANRYVNSGRAAGTLTANNTAGNPGTSISLTMKHALALVSFRFYNDGTFPGDGKVSSIKLRNSTLNEFGTHAAGQLLTKGTSPVMNVKSGTITTNAFSSVALTRTLGSLYTMVKAAKSNSETTASAFLVPWNKDQATTNGDAAKASPFVSMLAYPVASLVANALALEVVIDGNTYILPVSHSVSSWTKGQNYQYTVKASGKALSITTVNVVEWTNVAGGNLDL